MQQVFILGNPRSGTSLLRLILNNHANIVVPPESGFMLWWYKKYSNWTIKDIDNKELIEQFICDIMSSRKIETWNLDYNLLYDSIIRTKPHNYLALSQRVYLAYAAQRGKNPNIVGDKNNYYIHHLQELHQLAPNAKYLHIIRDGRDVACSYKSIKKLNSDSPYKPILPEDIETIANEWLINNSNILRLLRIVDPSNFFSVRYEDLILATESQVKSICSFFQIPYDENMMLYYKHNKLNKEEPLQTLDWKRKTLEKPDSNNIDKYKTILSGEEINEFNRIGEKVLKQFGYEC